MKEQIRLYATKSGKAVTKTINNVNPEATNLTLATFGTMMNDLTSNTYERTDRVTTVNCDSEPGGGTKPAPTLTLSRTSATASEINADANKSMATMTTNSDGLKYATAINPESDPIIGIAIAGDGLYVRGNISPTNPDLTLPMTVRIGVVESDNYAGAETTFTITA